MSSRPSGVLRSSRELEQFRVKSADGSFCGRIKDIYFDDSTWKVSHLVLSIEPSAFGRNEVLITPDDISEVGEEEGTLRLSISRGELDELPLASSVLPVCKQYQALAYASPGARTFAARVQNDPHLRSGKAVTQYHLDIAGAFAGRLADFIYASDSWEIRYLAVEHKEDGKAVRFHILPQAVERITWATQRIVLRELQPVSMGLGEVVETSFSEAAA